MFRLSVFVVVVVGIGWLISAIVTYISLATSRDRLAAALFVPYAAWVTFAGLLNAAIWRLN
jgi:tryptophan-rich sensory protein